MADFLANLLELVLTALSRVIIRRAQQMRPRFETHDGRRCLEISPNRASVVFWISGFLVIGFLGVAASVVILSRLEGHSTGDLFSSIAGELFVVSFPFALALGCLYFSFYCWKSRVLVFNDGLLFAFFGKKHRFLKWSDVDRLEYQREGREIIIFSQDSQKSRLDCHWNGIAFLFFCFGSFLYEEQWHDVKEEMEKYLRKKGNLDNIRSQLTEFLLNRPLDSFESAVKHRAEFVPPS